MLTAAVLGLGMIGRHHARLLQSMPGVRFAGAVDPGGDRFGAVADRDALYASLDELLAAQTPDFAVVAVPTDEHLPVVRRLAQGGVHVLVEKPLAATAAEEAARQTVEVAREAYRQASHAETSLLNMLASFTIAFGTVRASTHMIRTRGAFGPFRNVRLANSHIHHFVPGILLAFTSGGAAVIVKDERLDPWLAIPFGVGAALTLDESALLLKLDDVYWSEEGIVSVQITLAALGMLSGTVLALRVLRRGEQRVLQSQL